MYAAERGHTACVQALVAAKATLDRQSVSFARLFACPVTLESPSIFKRHQHPRKLARSCECVCACVYVLVCVRSSFVTIAFIHVIVRSCLYANQASICNA
jgi:hypothetical protein